MKILIALIVTSLLSAQAVEKTLGPIPATPTDVVAGTVKVFQLTLTNTTSSSVNCTVKTREATPTILFDDVVYGKASGSSSHYVFTYPRGIVMTNGFAWSCASANAVNGSVVYQP